MVGARSLDEDYLARSQSVDDAIDSLINWQTFNAGAVGFVTGVGGAITLPISVPANIASVTYLQLRIIAAIAHMQGHDIGSEQVRSIAFACLVGGAATDLLKDAGVVIGTKLARQAIQSIPGSTLKAITKAVGFRLVAKTGSTAPIVLTKMVAFVGGVISGGFDAVYIRTIGAAAKSVFALVTDPDINDPQADASTTSTP